MESCVIADGDLEVSEEAIAKYADLLPPLSTEEFAALKADIEANGVFHPVILDEDGNVLDGRHRLKIDKNVPRRVIAGLSEDEKHAFVIRANLTRRNLSPDQKREIRQKQKAIAQRLRKDDPKKWTQQAVASVLGVAQNTVSTWFTSNISTDNTGKTPDARVKLTPAAKEAVAEKVQSGISQQQVAADFGVSQQTVSNVVKKADAIHSRDDDKARKTAHLKASLFEVRRGDFREVLKDVTSVSLVLTDPPYPKESLPLWSDLGKWAANALADDGLLIAYSGQMFIPDVLNRLSEHLEFWWLGALIHKGSGNISPLGHPVRKVKNQWKPLVMFYKRGGSGFDRTFADLLMGEGCEKTHHNWQQPVAEAAALVERFTKKGELVVDPFAGSGGFCKAASDLGRKAIGAEILTHE